MPDASSPQLNQPTRSRAEYLHERIAEGKATPAEYGEWLHLEKPADTLRHRKEVPPVLIRGEAAVSATWLDAFHKLSLAQQAKR